MSLTTSLLIDQSATAWAEGFEESQLAERAAARSTFKKAVEYARKGQITKSRDLKHSLGNYPLAPYVEYQLLSSRLGQTSPAEIDAFRERYPDLPATPLLYQRWLKAQGQRRQWARLHSRRYDTTNADLQCYFVRAQYGVGEKSAALDATTKLWLRPKSQPKACDPIFSIWRGTKRFGQDIIWQRFNGAMQAGERVLARYLQRYMTGTRQTAAKAYYELARQPQRVSWRGAFSADTIENRDAISYGIRRYARRDARKAAVAWDTFRRSHAFSAVERQLLDEHIAVELARDGQFPEHDQRKVLASEFALGGMVNAAIAHQRWEEVLYWINRVSGLEAGKSRNQYWLARAQQQLGQPHSFAELATRRDYYGFMAAAQVNADIELNAAPAQSFSHADEMRLLAIPGIVRAVELFAVGDSLNARREWYRITEMQDASTLHQMAYLAQRMGKLFLAIQTANRADARDDLTLRFPTAYAVAFQEASLRHGVEPYLLQAVTRQESAFQVRVKSSAGALGLMQIMPATAKLAIRRGGLTAVMGSGSGKAVEQDLFIPERNIEIGSYHLSWLLRRYSGLRPLAIAAYNAGESRVDRWLSKARSIPMDVWIETIPFGETRNYVQNVLAFEVVYRELEQRSAPVLRGSEWVTPSG